MIFLLSIFVNSAAGFDMLFTWSNDQFRNYGIRISTIFLTNLDMFYHWLLLLFFVQCDWWKHSEKFRICSFEIGSGEQYSLQMTKFSVQSSNFGLFTSRAFEISPNLSWQVLIGSRHKFSDQSATSTRLSRHNIDLACGH